MECVITSPQSALDASPGMSGRVTALKGRVRVDFAVDRGGFEAFAVPPAGEAAGSADGAAEILRDALGWIHDPEDGFAIRGPGVRYGTGLSARTAAGSFGEAMERVSARAAEVLEIDAARRTRFAERMAEGVRETAPAAPGPR